MKSRVKWSRLSITITILVISIFLIAIIGSTHNMAATLALSAVLMLLILLAIFYSPVELSVNNREISIKKIIGCKKIPLDQIVTVSPYNPSPWLNMRLPGSFGLMGYWGWFADSETGTYFGYYGDNTDCIILKLKSGRQYVLGCRNSDEMAKYICNIISYGNNDTKSQ
ncbi:MAG: hypothetical protein K2L97_03440 [Muribaculaceae bacterium]|nr:hypothetical protein [Muribaculaceae bacterium]